MPLIAGPPLAPTDLFLVNLQDIPICHVELSSVSVYTQHAMYSRPTVSGVSCGFTRLPSKRKRTWFMAFPWRSQNAFMSLLSAVDRLILKKTSLLLSVTLILRCSVAEGSDFSTPGLPPPLSDMVRAVREERGSC